MAKRKSKQSRPRAKPAGLVPRGEPSMMDEADGLQVGDEPVPGMRLRCICRGHSGPIGRIAWSPCGRFIASPSADRTIRIWDADNGKCVAVLQGHNEAVSWVAWSPDGRRIASASDDKTVRVWTVAPHTSAPSGDIISIRDAVLLPNSTDKVHSVVWSPDGSTIAAGFQGGALKHWDIEAKKLVQSFQVYQNATLCLAWSPKGDKLAAGGGSEDILKVFEGTSDKVIQQYDVHNNTLWAIAWSPDGNTLVSASSDHTLAVHNVGAARSSTVLESHTEGVTSASFSADGQLLASKSYDGFVKLWIVDHLIEIASISEPAAGTGHYEAGLAFSPTSPTLASLGEQDCIIRVWDLNLASLLTRDRRRATVRYTSSKIVLVGESNVGKSCLAKRLAEDRYPEDHEHGTTHGMRFWPMEAERLHPSAKPPEGQRRDVVLWDFGGQDEYQLVHQMFLHDTTLALVLIDPTRGREAFDQARDWNKRLEKHLAGRRAVKLLVGAKQDRKSNLVNDTAIKALCKECDFKDFIDLSAKTNRRIPTLRKAIADALDWEHLAKTSRPELFQRIRDHIEKRRKRREVVVMLVDFTNAIQRSYANAEGGAFRKQDTEFDPAAVDAVSDQLATQGVIVRTKLTGGEEALVLQLPVIERYAGSLIVAARNNPRGVPALEERLLGSATRLPLPGMKKSERLDSGKERIVLECVVELMIQHGLCFRHGGLLVFPTLFPAGEGDGGKLPHSVSLYYDFTGAIDNIYASLVARLVVSEGFGEGRLWAGRVEFDRPSEGICGLRHIKRTGGLAHVDLFFGQDTCPERRNLFTRFVEEHLRQNGVEIKEHEAIKCTCGEVIEERIVQANIKRGEKDVVCPVCRRRTLVGEGVERIRQHDPSSDHKILALRKTVEEQTARDAKIAKSRVSGGSRTRSPDAPIRLLHLSDLHFTGGTSPQTHLVPLLQDIRKGDFLGLDSVEYLVISGDMTDRGNDEGLDKAREFVERLIDELGLSAQRCILVPGNHDVQDLGTSYVWRPNVKGLNDDQWIKQGDIYLVRDDTEYPKRLKKFSDAFFHKVVPAQPYPIDPAEQGIPYLFDDTRMQFLTFNSAWRIDQFHRKRSCLHPVSVSTGIAEADKQIADAVERGTMEKGQKVLRLCVWHHSIQHRETMQDTGPVELLQAADVRLCLHGDVHEMNREHFKYWHRKKMDVVGAGSFGSPAEGRTEAMPRLYNLIEIQPDHSSVRVHTRRRVKSDGPWDGWYEWDDPNGKGRVPYYDIDLA